MNTIICVKFILGYTTDDIVCKHFIDGVIITNIFSIFAIKNIYFVFLHYIQIFRPLM